MALYHSCQHTNQGGAKPQSEIQLSETGCCVKTKQAHWRMALTWSTVPSGFTRVISSLVGSGQPEALQMGLNFPLFTSMWSGKSSICGVILGLPTFKKMKRNIRTMLSNLQSNVIATLATTHHSYSWQGLQSPGKWVYEHVCRRLSWIGRGRKSRTIPVRDLEMEKTNQVLPFVIPHILTLGSMQPSFSTPATLTTPPPWGHTSNFEPK